MNDTIRMTAALTFERTAPEGSGRATETIRRGDEFDATPDEARGYFHRPRPLARPVDAEGLSDAGPGSDSLTPERVAEYIRGLDADARAALLAEFRVDGEAPKTSAPARKKA